MKRIILPTDFSKNAYNALKYAVNLFKDQEITFILLHTYMPPVYQAEYILGNPAQIGLGDIYGESSKKNLVKLKNKIEKAFKNPKHRFIVHTAYNMLINEMLETIEGEKADMVIMGTKGATGAKEIFLGSYTVSMIKRAPCPVIAVPSNFEYEAPKEILFPTDYEINYQRQQLIELIELANDHKSSIEVVHVSTGYPLSESQAINKKKLESILSGTTYLCHDLPNQSVLDGINNFQMKKRMNLLVMIQNKHTFLERLFIEPVIKKIGFHVTIPFMVLPHFNK